MLAPPPPRRALRGGVGVRILNEGRGGVALLYHWVIAGGGSSGGEQIVELDTGDGGCFVEGRTGQMLRKGTVRFSCFGQVVDEKCQFQTPSLFSLCFGCRSLTRYRIRTGMKMPGIQKAAPITRCHTTFTLLFLPIHLSGVLDLRTPAMM